MSEKRGTMLTVFDSATIAVPDRLEAWRSTTAASLVPTSIDSPDPRAFTARLGARSLGAAQAASLSYTSLSTRRSPKMIRASDPEHYLVGLIRAGQEHIGQHQTREVLRPGDFVIYDSSQPFEAHITSHTSPAQTALLQFPKHLLPLPGTRVADLCALPLPGTRGVGRLLAQFLVGLTTDRSAYTDRDALRLENIAVDLTTAVLAHHLERENPPLRSPTYVLYLRIVAFIEENLHRPDLRPAAIAAAHQVSARYLHRIFQQHHPVSVATHVRNRRLDRARRDLADRRLDHLTIATIARRWGFARPADFSRAFQRHAGISPSDYRNST